MGISLLPDPNNPEPLVSAPTPNPENPAPVIEPEPIAPTPVQDVSKLMEQGYLEERQRRIQLENEFAEFRRTQAQPAPVQNINDESYYNTPATATRQIVQEEITRALAPIAAQTQQQLRMSQYNTLKAQVRASGALPDFAILEPRIDQYMANLEPTFENFKNALIYTRGLMSFETPATVTTPASTTKVTPPYIPPTPPSGPTREDAVKFEPLTETERRIMRGTGIKSEEEFRAWQNMSNPKILTDLTPKPN